MASFLMKIFLTILIVSGLNANDLGVYGSTAEIQEEDLILFLKKKIDSFSENDCSEFMQAMQSRIVSQLNKTMAIEGIEKAKIYSVKYVDPSICVSKDILNHEGQVVIRKGTQYNPLSQISLNHDLLFFDATDQEQLSWAESYAHSAKWILVKGKPMQLEKELERPVYFDQGGVLTKKFGIEQVPACVSQDGLRLKIEFILLGDTHA